MSPLAAKVKSAGTIQLGNMRPFYQTPLGCAYLCDSLEALKSLPSNSINLIVTSPPYALHFQKSYGNISKDKYVKWFLPFASEMFRVLTDDGSFVLNIGGSYNKGTPTRSLYHFKLLVALVEEIGFHLAQECFWYNPAKMPMPAEWVTVRRIRVKDSVEYVWWFSKTEWPKASNKKVLRERFSADMYRLNRKGVKETTRPGGYKIRSSWAKIKSTGAIPPNFIQQDFFEEQEAPEEQNAPESVLVMGNNAANDAYTLRCKEAGLKVHPARFPRALPDFFIKLLTDERDVVLDPFAGSNTTGSVAESLGRHWIALESVHEYLRASQFRFNQVISSE